MKRHDILQSMSRKVDPYDNAVAENFFSCLKCELVYLRHFTTRAAAKAALFWYIEAFYNSVRPHSALEWVAPKTFEKDWRLTAAASAMKAVAIR
ncbi:MAG: integrase core domain-containing protein [Ethanoligenens sp.]